MKPLRRLFCVITLACQKARFIQSAAVLVWVLGAAAPIPRQHGGHGSCSIPASRARPSFPRRFSGQARSPNRMTRAKGWMSWVGLSRENRNGRSDTPFTILCHVKWRVGSTCPRRLARRLAPTTADSDHVSVTPPICGGQRKGARTHRPRAPETCRARLARSV